MPMPFKVSLVVPRPNPSLHCFPPNYVPHITHPIVPDLITLIKLRPYTVYCERINCLNVTLSLIIDLLRRL
jgi:hypothetical protein